MNDNNMQAILDQLRKPFHPSNVVFKPGAVKGDRAMALAYADVRAYMNRLDEVCGADWSVAYEPWGNDRLICRLTIGGIVRCSTGESTNESEKNEIGGTVAEAQAFKRACAMFGLGRYLYTLPTGWADFDPATKRFTEQAKFKLTGILLQHYRRATGNDGTTTEPSEQDSPAPTSKAAERTPALSKTGKPLTPQQELWSAGEAVFGEDWDMARGWLIAQWTTKITPANTRNSSSDLTSAERLALADYITEKAVKLAETWVKQKANMEKAA